MLSQLEGAMDAIIKVFYKYSGKEGDKYTLTKAELKDLLKGELGAFLKVNFKILAQIPKTKHLETGCVNDVSCCHC